MLTTSAERSDFPFTRASGVELLLQQMDSGVKELFSSEEIEDVYHGNAEKVLSSRKTKI